MTDFVVFCTAAEFEKDEAGLEKRASNIGVKIHFFDQVLANGKEKPTTITAPKPTDLATIMYTSGTTGTFSIILHISQEHQRESC
jgi:long-subunit acyl-CoA synthetase (AMP-forming)